MKKITLISTALIIAALFTCTAATADSLKIGMVNFEKIIRESNAGKKMQKELKTKVEQLQGKLKAEEKRVKTMKEALEREALVLSAEKKLERQREFRDKADDLKKMSTDYSQEMQLMQNKMMQQIQKDIFDITNKIGKAKGYSLIIERKVGGVVYAADTVDITDEVIKAYNAKK